MKKGNLAEIHDFTSEEAQQLLHNKFVVVIGDSNYRAIYKDLVYFLQTDAFLSIDQLREKHEACFANDCLVELKESSGNDYHLVRQYRTRHHLVRFYFIARAYSSYVESILSDFRAALEAGLAPDVVIVHSCLWDLNRYHDVFPTEPPVPKAIREYRQNVERLFQALDEVLPATTLVIWNTAMAVTKDARCYIMQQPCKVSAKDMIEANFYSSSLAQGFWFDTLDLHYHFRFLQHLHAVDGTHWNFRAHRHLTKILLTHLADTWQVELDKQPPRIGIQMFCKEESQLPPSPRRSVDPASPQLIPSLWTNSSDRGAFYSRRPFHLRRLAHKERLRGRPSERYQLPVQLGGLRLEEDPWPSGPLPDHGNSPIGLDSRPISSSEGPHPVLGYYPHGPERSEEEHCLQPGPNFNFHTPRCVGQDSWPIPSFEGEQGLPHYYDGSHAHEDPFHAGCDATPISGQEHRPPPNSGSSWVPDNSGGHNRPIHFIERGLQFYPSPYVPPFQDGGASSFADQGPRFHPNSPSYFPQGVGDASTPLSMVAQEPPHYFQAAPGPGDENRGVGFPEGAPWPLFPPILAMLGVALGPQMEAKEIGALHSTRKKTIPVASLGQNPFPPEEEGWAPYSLPRRIPPCDAWTGSRKMLPQRPRRANHQRQACAPYAASRKRSRDPY